MSLPKYGIDTFALLRYLTGNLTPKVDPIFKQAEDSKVELIIPSIVLGELIYTVEKGRNINGKIIPKENLELILSTIYSTNNLLVSNLSQTGWRILMNSTIPELHDRIIVATCIQENVRALITSDSEIMSSDEITIIW